MNVRLAAAIDRLEREHDRELRSLAAQVRNQYVVPSCLRSGVRFVLDRHTLDYWIEDADGYALLNDQMARAHGFRQLRWCFEALETPAGRWPAQNEARVREDRGGVPVLAMFMRNYTPPTLRARKRKPVRVPEDKPLVDQRPGIDDDGRAAAEIAASHATLDRY